MLKEETGRKEFQAVEPVHVKECPWSAPGTGGRPERPWLRDHKEIIGAAGAKTAGIFGLSQGHGKLGSCWISLKQRIGMIQLYLIKKNTFGNP